MRALDRIQTLVDRLQGRHHENPWLRRVAEVGSVTILFTVLVAVVLAMKGYNPASDHIGKGFSDPEWELEDWNSHIWAMWHFHKVYLGEATLSFTNWQFFPEGLFTANVFGNPLLLVGAGLAAVVVSPEKVLVLTALVILVGNGLGGYILVRVVSGSRLAGLVCGLFFCFGGVSAWAINSGNFEYGVWFWLCIYLAALDRVVRFGRKGDVALGIATGTLAVLGNLAFVFNIAGISALLVLFRWRTLVRQRWVSVAALALGCALLLSPMVVLFASGGQAERTPLADGVPENTGGGVESDLKVAYLNSYPAIEYMPWKRTPYREDSATWFLLWALVVTSFLLVPERAGPWLVAGGVLFVVALGPFSGVSPQGGQGAVRLPFYFLHEYVPFFKYMHFPHRVFALVVLTLGVAAGLGFAALLKRPLFLRYRWAGPALAALVFIELIATWSLRHTERLEPLPFHQQLAQDQDEYALAVFPTDLGTLDARYLYYQTLHNKRLVNGAFPRYLPKKVPTWEMLNGNAIMRGAYVLQQEDLPDVIRNMLVPLENTAVTESPAELETARRELASLGIGYLVFHRKLDLEKGVRVEFPKGSRLEVFLREALGEPEYEDEWLVAWRPGKE